MTVYADFDYYIGTYGGTVFEESSDYLPCAARASLHIDELTLGRAEANADNERVKLACCAIAEQVKLINDANASMHSGKAQMRSQSVGSFSVTFGTSDELIATAKAQIGELARLYLGSTGLLYRGVPRIWD